MHTELERVLPNEIEARSMELLTAELPHPVPPEHADVIKRVIHTTADFDYADTLCFSPEVCAQTVALLQGGGVTIVTDTMMAFSGVNKAACRQLGVEVRCLIAEEAVAAAARDNGTTRAAAAVDMASAIPGPVIFAVGNAPTALVRIYERMQEGTLSPALIIGVPVGFVNVVQSKELILQSGAPYIVARGRKGGSNVAAAICNALLYRASGRPGRHGFPDAARPWYRWPAWRLRWCRRRRPASGPAPRPRRPL